MIDSFIRSWKIKLINCYFRPDSLPLIDKSGIHHACFIDINAKDGCFVASFSTPGIYVITWALNLDKRAAKHCCRWNILNNIGEKWWGLKQHCGSPSRFIDFIRLPYIAAYCVLICEGSGQAWTLKKSLPPINTWYHGTINFITSLMEPGKFNRLSFFLFLRLNMIF